jgi:hypothetical protein
VVVVATVGLSAFRVVCCEGRYWQIIFDVPEKLSLLSSRRGKIRVRKVT